MTMPEVPPAIAEVDIRKSMRIAMPDGVRLSTDFYLPKNQTAPFPVILVRTPYGKDNFEDPTGATPGAMFFASRGYAVAVQDKRGKFESEGTYKYCAYDGPDSYATADWLRGQPFCDGNIGLYGCSYLGDTQLALAKMRHPAVKCMIPQCASMIGSLRGHYTMGDTRLGGAFYLATYIRWFYERGSKLYYHPPADIAQDLFVRTAPLFRTNPLPPKIDYNAAAKTLPLVDMFKGLSAPPSDWRDVLTKAVDDPWWNDCGFLTDDDRIKIPALHVNSWFDVAIEDTIIVFDHIRRTAGSAVARDNQYLLISPSMHCGSEKLSGNDSVGELFVGDARLPYHRLYLDWFDHWLKGIDNGVNRQPRVRFYLMGANEWRIADDWPVPDAEKHTLYLHSDGRANTRAGDGRLEVSTPTTSNTDQFDYDPFDPVMTVGGAEPPAYLRIAPRDQSEVEDRPDVLVYTSAQLERDLDVVGPIEVVLYVSSSAPDTDFTAKLIDLEPSGRALDLRDGILRCRYRESRAKESFLVPGRIYEIRISLQATAMRFAAGHHIRLEVSSSNFPKFDRNLNTGGNNWDEVTGQVAHNSVHHSPNHPSRLVLQTLRPDDAQAR